MLQGKVICKSATESSCLKVSVLSVAFGLNLFWPTQMGSKCFKVLLALAIVTAERLIFSCYICLFNSIFVRSILLFMYSEFKI